MRRLLFWFGLPLAMACGSDVSPPTGTPSTVSIATQPPTVAQSGVALVPAPVISLLDQSGAKIASRGVLVTASLASGAGTVAGVVEIRTDAQGEATFADLRIVGATGPKALRFSAAGLTSATSTSIALSAGLPATMTPSAGNNQTGPAGTALPVAPAVLVVDGAGNPAPNVSVAFAVTAGGGAVGGGTAVSGADGIAKVASWTLGTGVGVNTLTATAGALQVVFSATGTVGAPAKIDLVEGDAQTTTIGNPVPLAPTVKVTDAFDNPVSGVSVTFTPGAGGGVVVGGNPQTDATGVAKVGSWSVGLTPGAHTLVASRTGATNLTFTATATDFQIVTIASGAFASCGLTAAGTGYCWGDNSDGQLGDSTSGATSSVPVRVKSGNTTFAKIAMGGAHACALTPAGAAFCWGNNSSGQLGDSTTTSASAPIPVLGNHTFQAISVGDLHSCALDLAGNAWCWGNNGNGRLGDSTNTARPAPVAVKNGVFFTAISAGSSHTCGRTVGGALYCWGSNTQGRLGDGTTVDQRAPTLVSSPGTNFSMVAAGGSHTCALTAGGTAMCWGGGGSGTLGNGATTGQLTPTAVSGTTTFATIATGTVHSCAVTAAGQAYCWGSNVNGRLGDGTLVNRLVPTAVISSLVAGPIDLGFEHSCVISQAGSAICWGRDLEGQLGDGGTVSMPRPVGVKRP